MTTAPQATNDLYPVKTTGDTVKAGAARAKSADPKAAGPVTVIKGPEAAKLASAPAPSTKDATKLPEAGSRSTPKIAPINGIHHRGNSYFALPSSLAVEPGFNPRFDMGEIEELAKSIKANGLMTALRVRRVGTGTFKIIGGHRRKAAIDLILKSDPMYFDETGVPIVIEDSAISDIDELVRMFEDNGGKPFLPLEEAIAYKKMRDAKMTIKQIVARVGRKHMHVQEMLTLLESDPELVEAVKTGEIGVTMAKRIATDAKGDAETQKMLIAAAKQANKTTGGKKAKQAAQRAVKAKVEEARKAKAKKAGRTLKMRALSDDELKALGVKVEAQVLGALDALGLSAETDMHAYMKKAAQDQHLAFSYGVLQGLIAAAGVDVKLSY